MNWLTRTISKVFPRKKKSLDIAENAWIKCSQCQTMLYSSDLEKTLFVCPNCDEHLQIHPRIRFKNLFEKTPGFQSKLSMHIPESSAKQGMPVLLNP